MYHVLGRPRSRAGRVLWLLEELDQNYHLSPHMPHAEEVFEHNPTGKIPVLLDGEVVVSDSTAICRYLTDKHNRLTFETGSKARARLDSIVHFLIDDLEQPIWNASKHTFVLPEQHRLEGMKPVCKWEFARAQKILEYYLADGPFLMGDDFTYADVIAGHIGAWSKMAKFEWRDGPVSDYFRRVLDRPSNLRAMERGRKS